MARWKELPASVRTFDHKAGFALRSRPPDNHRQLAKQRVMHRRNPHTFDVAGTALLSLMAG